MSGLRWDYVGLIKESKVLIRGSAVVHVFLFSFSLAEINMTFARQRTKGREMEHRPNGAISYDSYN